MAYPMTQWGQGNRPVMVPRVPDFMEQIAPTLLNFLGQYGLQKASQGFQAGQATEKATGEAAAAQLQRDWETNNLKLELGSKERIASYKTDKDYELKWLDLKGKGQLTPGSLADASKQGAPAPGEIPRPPRFGGGTSKIVPEPATFDEEKAAVFHNMTPEQKVAYLMKPGVSVNVGDITKKTLTTSKAKDVALMKSPRFRAGIVSDVAQLNSKEWPYLDVVEKADLVREEADIRVRKLYPGAQYGNGDEGKGWYVKKDGKWVLEVSWSEALEEQESVQEE